MDRGKPTLELLRPSASELGAAFASASAEPTVFGLTDCGNTRANNEDQFLVAKLERAVVLEQSGFGGITPAQPRRIVDQPSARLLMVADGMGGHNSGEVASSVVVDAMANYAFSMMPWLSGAAALGDATAEDLKKAVDHARQRVSQVAARKGLSPDLGTTLTMAYVAWPTLHVVHVGDSRAYLYRAGELFRLTRDHNLADEMVRRKVLTEAQARASSFTRLLTNAVAGSRSAVEVELHRLALEPADLLLLCTDGLYAEVEDSAIAASLANVTSAELVEPCVRSLVAAAKHAGGRDNVTAVLARF